MPSGCTYKIYEFKENPNYTTKDFILDCAQQFGGFVKHEESFIRNFQRDIEYYETMIEKAEKKIGELLNLSDEELRKEIEEKNKKYLSNYKTSLERKSILAAHYDKFINGVEKWEVPTEEHQGLKEFCLKQLKESKEWDAFEPLEPSIIKTTKEAIKEHRNHMISSYQKDINHSKERIKTIEDKIKDSLEWTNALKASLEEM